MVWRISERARSLDGVRRGVKLKVDRARPAVWHPPDPAFLMQIGLYLDIGAPPALPREAFDFIEENVQTLLVPEQEEAAFERRAAMVRALAWPVPVANRFLPADLKVVGPAVDGGRLERWGRTAFRRAQALGVGRIVWGSGVARRVPEGFPMEEAREQFAGAVRRLAPLAEDHGVRLLIEPVSRGDSNFIRSLAEGADMVAQAGHRAVGLLADLFHMMVEGEPASEIVRHGALLEHVHLAELKNRAVPGTHGDDFGPYLRALKEIGYKGALVLEPEWTDLRREPAVGLAALRTQMSAAGLA